MDIITSLSQEKRKFKPSSEFKKQANLRSFAVYKKLYDQSIKNPVRFWSQQAKQFLFWRKPFDRVLEWKSPHAKWFSGGKLNVAENCLDRHINNGLADKPAIIFEGEPGNTRTLTYGQLHREVCKLANGIKSLGLKKGDRAAIYLPLVPEAAIAMLACARLGVIHTVIFGGFSAEAIRDRINDCGAKLVITADGGWRRGKIIELKAKVDEAIIKTPSVKQVLILKHTSQPVTMKKNRDRWWHELMADISEVHTAPAHPSETPLFILYTSGSTGKPKGVLHTSAGYLLGTTITSHYVFDLKPSDIYWCTADIGWITGHSYVVYGPLSCGATILMYEGAPDYPAPDRFWHIIDTHKVTIFYTAPTAIRTFMRWGEQHIKKHSLKSLRLLGSVGEPINPEVWIWYHTLIGKKRCPIVDTWWQTETGAIMITPLPGIMATKPGSCALPFFGVQPKILDQTGKKVPRGSGGRLFLSQPWPSMLRTLWHNNGRFKKEYWEAIPDLYFCGDGARQDRDGYFWIIGRIDDVLNVSGHRIGTAEVESALVSHPSVIEAAVVGRPDSIKGQAIVVFATLKTGTIPSEQLRQELIVHISRKIGSLAKPDSIRFTAGLPKTRSGKIMRRLLKELATFGTIQSDITTLEDLSVIATLQAENKE